jgi:Trehalose utilisation
MAIPPDVVAGMASAAQRSGSPLPIARTHHPTKRMRRLRPLVSAVLIALGAGLVACEPPPPARVLVFSRTAGFRHSSIDAGKKALIALGTANGMIVDTTEDVARITEDSLKQYAAVVFLQTTGNLLDRAAEVDLQRYIRAGGGFVGIHAAALVWAPRGRVLRRPSSHSAGHAPRGRSQ